MKVAFSFYSNIGDKNNISQLKFARFHKLLSDSGI